MESINEVTLEKTYEAPAKKVWQAWTNPEMLKQWWGPKNVTIPECEIDLRVGGKFYIVMEATEGMGQFKGTKWPMMAKFTAVKPNSKLSYRANAWTEGAAKEETTIDQSTDVTLTEEKGKTTVKVKAVIHNPKTAPKMAVEGMIYGFSEQLDKLDTFLTTQN